MGNQDNFKNIKSEYYHGIMVAVATMISRSCDDGIEGEQTLTGEKRELFIHSGVSTFLAKAMHDDNREVIETFDYLLEYIVKKDLVTPDKRAELFSKLIGTLFDKFEGNYPETRDMKFCAFVSMIHFAFMIYHEYVPMEDAGEVLRLSATLMADAAERQVEKKRKEAEKN